MDAPLASGRFVFGERLIFIPPPPYPPGAALFEHQRAQLGGCGVLQPERMDHGGCKMLPADEAVPVLTDHAARELPASTAYKVWPAAYDLAHRLSVLNIAGKSVLELGAGCGLPGLAAWCVGARRVLLTDVAENIPRLSQLIEQNGASSAVAVAELDWTQPVPATIASAGWDLVVAADCVFWPELWLPLLNTLAAITNGRPRATPPPRVLLTIVDRLGRARAFCDATHAAGWALERIDKPILCQQPVAIQSPELYELRWVGE
uniref:Calmodulin-lysine N-methyltransferase n=1 Tax=Haptolina ericina TaxID=156174 RepID=A0A7S3FL12_9EUKA|mmetsp:Transcript_9210/g.20702  ORF Transcript_9210/g.20702 Transcript_9210/m.20702 type:complete len:262 (+) Transcript_9210:30-815(+)